MVWAIMVPMSICRGFAVLDFETTGLSAARGDRAIEVGIVHVAPDGTLEDETETLIHVQRDLGLQALHHINAAELMEAPEFSGIARHLGSLLKHRVFVAHNAAFDSSFLRQEYARLGYDIPVDDSNTICTLKLARKILGVGGLAKCCALCGIDNADAHSALSDAHATAELLNIFMAEDPHWLGWSSMMSGAAAHDWPEILEKKQQWVPRISHLRSPPPTSESFSIHNQSPTHAPRSLSEYNLCELLAQQHPTTTIFPDDANNEAEYMNLLNASLINAQLSVHDKFALVELAHHLELSLNHCKNLHEEYFQSRAQAIWEEGVPKKSERQTLTSIGNVLSISQDIINQAIADSGTNQPITKVTIHPTHRPHVLPSYQQFTLVQGDYLALTGSMRRKRSEWEEMLRAIGLTPQAAVTKKTHVLVAADPDSESTKARKARSYHIPIVDEQWLEDAISNGIDISAQIHTYDYQNM